jgi:ABC-type Mn2+/Zn2+ transport system permease subunit
MVAISSILGIIGVLAGILVSVKLDWPTGPSIVVTLFGVLVLSTLLSLLAHKHYSSKI